MDNSDLIARITAFIEAQTEEISKKDLTSAVGKIYDSLKKTKVEGEVKKRAPSPYNIFMKEEMAKLKDNKDMSSTEKFKHVAILWNQKKEEEKVEEVKVEEEKVEVVKKEKKAKKPKN
jgi:hypothetical protein